MWDKKFANDDYFYGTNGNDFLVENASSIPQGEVLCIGEGEGRNSVFLATQGYSVTAVDASSVGLKKVEKLAKSKNVSVNCIHADLNDFVIEPNKWSGIVSIFCHLPSELQKKVHQGIVKGLKNNGVYLLEAYTPQQIGKGTGGPPIADLMVTKNSLQAELSALNIERCEEVEREIIEGTGHTGTGAVAQFIGKKTR